MQGRLLPRPYLKLKAFPHTLWRDEFYLAANLGMSCIEWVFEADRYEDNPIWDNDGRKEICDLVNKTGVQVPSLCADYFLTNPLHRDANGTSLKVFKKLVQKASQIGISLILIPVLEEAELKSIEEKKLLIAAINSCDDLLKKHKIKIGLETELSAQEYSELVKAFNNKSIGAYYDSGNLACKGYNMKQDIEVLFPILFGVHIKDRPFSGTSVYIGSGDANFKEGIPLLCKKGYNKPLIFESFYENDPIGTMKQNIIEIKNCIDTK